MELNRSKFIMPTDVTKIGTSYGRILGGNSKKFELVESKYFTQQRSM